MLARYCFAVVPACISDVQGDACGNLYRRQQSLPETAGRFELNVRLPIPFDGAVSRREIAKNSPINVRDWVPQCRDCRGGFDPDNRSIGSRSVRRKSTSHEPASKCPQAVQEAARHRPHRALAVRHAGGRGHSDSGRAVSHSSGFLVHSMSRIVAADAPICDKNFPRCRQIHCWTRSSDHSSGREALVPIRSA